MNSGRRDYHGLYARLINWGAYCRSDTGGPDGSCQNSIWRQWIPHKHWEEGWGDLPTEPIPDREIDDQDAEFLDARILELAQAPRAILVCRFVLRRHIGWRELDPAIRILQDRIEWVSEYRPT